jgi:hypothetical protein
MKIDDEYFEVYKKIEGYENYHVSNSGNVINSKTGKIRKPTINNSGFFTIALYKDTKIKSYLLHRLIAVAFVENPDNKSCICHIDHNKLNNNLENLRFSTSQENSYHSSIVKNASSKYRGVFFSKMNNKFKAQIMINGKQQHLGYFNNERDALKIYETKAKELHGEFYFKNDPQI